MEYINYLLTAKNGTKVLIWGGDPTTDQINLCKALSPDIAIVHRYTKPEQCVKLAEFVKEIGCKVVIPHHHDFHKIDPPEVLQSLKDAIAKATPDVEFINPKHGVWMSF